MNKYLRININIMIEGVFFNVRVYIVFDRWGWLCGGWS